MTLIYQTQRIVDKAKFLRVQQAIVAAGPFRNGYAYQCALERLKAYENGKRVSGAVGDVGVPDGAQL